MRCLTVWSYRVTSTSQDIGFTFHPLDVPLPYLHNIQRLMSSSKVVVHSIKVCAVHSWSKNIRASNAGQLKGCHVFRNMCQAQYTQFIRVVFREATFFSISVGELEGGEEHFSFAQLVFLESELN